MKIKLFRFNQGGRKETGVKMGVKLLSHFSDIFR